MLRHHHRQPELQGESGDGTGERFGRDPDDGTHLAVDAYGAAEKGRIPAEASLPKTVTDHSDGLPTLRVVFFGQKGPAQGGIDAEHLEEVRGDDLPQDELRVPFYGQDGSRHRRAVKVWDKREFRNLDNSLELGTRNMKVALRRLRRFARQGAADELDLPDTIESTAKNAGMLDIKMVPVRHNATKVLLCLDVGGSMDDHVKICEELFSAASSEFKHLEYFYFHNCVYEGLWKDNLRRNSVRLPTLDLMHKYPADYKLILVGDATMSPYEIQYPGGSVEHWNEESGATWMKRLLDTYPKAIWLNPEPQERWPHTPSIQMLSELMSQRMYPLTVSGLEQGMRELS